MKATYRILPTLYEESRAPWVWLPPSDCPNTRFVRILNVENGRAINCERRTVDSNFRRLYNERPHTNALPDSVSFIVMSAPYRDELGLGPATEAKLEIREANAWGRHFGLYRHHPDPVVRLAVLLGLLSVALGIAGIALGLASLMK